jgi:hypothetical protein
MACGGDIYRMQVMHLEFTAQSLNHSLKPDAFALLQPIKHLFVRLVLLSVHRQHQVCEDTRLRWLHFNEQVQFDTRPEQTLLSWLHLSEVALPLYNIVFIFIVPEDLGVH